MLASALDVLFRVPLTWRLAPHKVGNRDAFPTILKHQPSDAVMLLNRDYPSCKSLEDTFYNAAAGLVRAFTAIAQNLVEAGFTEAQVEVIHTNVADIRGRAGWLLHRIMAHPALSVAGTDHGSQPAPATRCE